MWQEAPHFLSVWRTTRGEEVTSAPGRKVTFWGAGRSAGSWGAGSCGCLKGQRTAHRPPHLPACPRSPSGALATVPELLGLGQGYTPF